MDARQLLAKWIAENTTQAQFARDVGCSESHLSLVLSKDRGWSLPMARKMSKATGGAVPFEAFVAEPVEEAAE